MRQRSQSAECQKSPYLRHSEESFTAKIPRPSKDGKGTLTATINYDTGVVTVKDFNGAVRTESLAAVVANAANELEKIPAEQRQELMNRAQLRITPHDVCPYLVTAIGFGHDAAWQAALSLVGVNPAIAVLVGLGFAFFWAWVSSHC